MMRFVHNRSASLHRWTACGPARISFFVVAVLVVSCAFLLAPVFAMEEEPPVCDEPVVPPGQDALLAAMLGRGAALPDACTFAEGLADGPIIRARYACPSGDVVFALVHPTNAAPTSLQTERFALALQSGSASDELVGALLFLIRSGEASFDWKVPADEAHNVDGTAGAQD